MTLDSVPVVALFVATILIVMLRTEGGYRLGRMAHRPQERKRKGPPTRAPCLLSGAGPPRSQGRGTAVGDNADAGSRTGF